MAELHQILGSIFRDIAQARVTSDLFSRNISQYYEQDPLLRRFPAPRTDIEEVEVDLKFVLTGLEKSIIQDESREASSATIFIKIATDITESFFDTILKIATEYHAISSDTEKRLKGFELRIKLKQNLLLYFQRQRHLLIKKGKFDDKEALEYIKTQLKRVYKEQLDELNLNIEQPDEFRKKVFEKLNVESQLEAMRKPLQEAYTSEGDSKVAVEVTVDKLAETPDAAICSIKVKARVRNYIWSKVEHAGKSWRSLNPE